MLFKRIIIHLAVAMLTVASFGCASIDKAPAELDQQAKEFKSDPETAQVYVYRDETFGAAVSMPVSVNGELAGNTGPKSFFKFDLLDGTHKITSQGDESILELEVEKGNMYYVWQEVKMGAFSAGSELQLVDEKTGQSGVNQCTMIKSKL